MQQKRIHANTDNNPAKSKLCLNWLLIDEQFNYVPGSCGFIKVTRYKTGWTAMANNGISIAKSDYLFVYLSNETIDQDVFFDNLVVQHYPNHRLGQVTGPLTEETQYYPFGLVMSGISSKAYGRIDNRYKYNGKEEQRREFTDGSGLEWLDYGARMYDVQIGRWHVADPLAMLRQHITPYNYCQNDPINRVDPTGTIDEAPSSDGYTDWVQLRDAMIYDSRVTDPESAKALYGNDAIYRAPGYRYTSSDGSDIVLGDLGFFLKNGKLMISADKAEEALKNAEKEVAEVKRNYAVSIGTMVFISADVSLPDPTDAVLGKWIFYAAAAGVAAYYLAKMQREIEGILQRAGGPQGVQYSLRAIADGQYPCYTCIFGVMNMRAGEVWKYGETINPQTRYSEKFKGNIGVEQFDEFYGNQVQIKIVEKTKIYSYFLLNAHLPPGNKIFR